RRAAVSGRRLGTPTVLVSIAVLTAAGVALYAALREGPDARIEKSVAVLPMARVGGDTAQEYFADGMRDEITTALTRVPGLRVIPKSSVDALKSRAGSSRELGKLLGASSFVEGEVFLAEGRLRVSAHLTNVANDSLLWSDSFTRDRTDIFAVQDEIAHAIAGALRLRLGADAKSLVAPGTRNIEAHDVFLRAKFLVEK